MSSQYPQLGPRQTPARVLRGRVHPNGNCTTAAIVVPMAADSLRDDSSLRGSACSEAVLLKLRTHPGAHLGGGFTAGGFRYVVQMVGGKRLQSSTQLRCSFARAD
jgi:hypothetical protein